MLNIFLIIIYHSNGAEALHFQTIVPENCDNCLEKM